MALPWTPNFSKELLESLLEQFSCTNFVETGSGQGFTPICVEPYFEQLFTCDIAPDYYETTWLNTRTHPKIKSYLGDSPIFLTLLRHTITSGTMFWLDAHSDVPGEFGWQNPQPLLEELKSIGGLRRNDVILIDDIRLLIDRHDQLYPLPGCIMRALEPWNSINTKIVGDIMVITPTRKSRLCRK